MSTRVVFIVAASSLGVLLAGARAQDQAPDAPKQEGEPSPLPSLDDLLGTGSDNPAPPEEEADTTPEVSGAGEDELDRLLSGEQIADEFTSAVRLMGKSAARLRQSRATGLATQRLQEDVQALLGRQPADPEDAVPGRRPWKRRRQRDAEVDRPRAFLGKPGARRFGAPALTREDGPRDLGWLHGTEHAGRAVGAEARGR